MKEGEYWGKRDQDDVNDVCLAALEYGSAFFDTAEVYQAGRSEESLAAALSAAPSALSGKAVVATKIQPQNCGDVRRYLDASLRPVFDIIECFTWKLPFLFTC